MFSEISADIVSGRIAEVRSRSIYRRKAGNEFGMDESLSVQMVCEKIEIC